MEEAPDIFMELDMAWAYAAGVNNEAYCALYRDRIRFLHVKDVVVENGSVSGRNIGEGAVDLLPALKQAAPDVWFIVENEKQNCTYADMELCINNLKGMLL